MNRGVNMYNPFKILNRFVSDPMMRFRYLAEVGCYNQTDDEQYLTKKYQLIMKKPLHLHPPVTFNEKIQWLKIYDRRPEYSIYVDKYRVRDFIKKTLGEEYLIPLLAVYDTPDEIDFDKLPAQFVLKCNHNSGKGMYVCRDKAHMDRKKVVKELWKGIKEDYYLINREWPYKDVPRKIICEKYMTNNTEKDTHNSTGLIDYKFFCFNGEPRYLYVSQGLENHSTARMSFLTLDWQFANFGRSDYMPLAQLPEKPVQLDNMIQIARKLSEGIAFLRVDLYEIEGKIYFGELTFSPCAGFMPFNPPEADDDIGKELIIPNEQK